MGAAVAVILMHPARPVAVVEAAVAGGMGGLLPDLDEPGSTISNAPRILGRITQRSLRRATKRTPLRLLGVLAGWLIQLAAALLNIVSHALSKLVRFVSGGHREGTHWVVVWALLSAAVFALTAPLAALDGKPYVGIGFCVGYLSHLCSDGCTRSGIPLVPYTSLRLHLLPRLLRIRTGTAGETLFTFAYIILLTAALYVVLPHDPASLFSLVAPSS